MSGTVTVEPLAENAVNKLKLAKTDPRFAFKIVTGARTWLLVASTKEELDGWVHTLRSCIRVI